MLPGRDVFKLYILYFKGMLFMVDKNSQESIVKSLEDRLFSKTSGLYSKIGVKNSEICRDCHARYEGDLKNPDLEEFSNPLSIWFVGSNFYDDPYKVMFVGKMARGDPGAVNDQGIIHDWKQGIDYFSNYPYPYWRYSRDIIMATHDVSADEAWKYTVISNMVKCNSGDNDNLNTAIKQNCLLKERVIWKEIEILKPKNIIFYTSWEYDDYIRKYIEGLVATGLSVTDKTDIKHRIPIGGEPMPWWSMELREGDGKIVMRLLRIGHPERKSKADFVRNVTDWIKSSDEA